MLCAVTKVPNPANENGPTGVVTTREDETVALAKPNSSPLPAMSRVNGTQSQGTSQKPSRSIGARLEPNICSTCRSAEKYFF
jgi:hypothetical protein